MQQNQGFDKNSLINFIILSVLLFGSMLYFNNRNKEKQISEDKTKVESTLSAPTPSLNTASIPPANIQKIELKNQELSLVFSSIGGQVTSVQLNQYNAYDPNKKARPVYLFNQNNSAYGFQFRDRTGKVFHTKDLIFTPKVNGNTLSLTANANGAIVEFIYTLLPKYTLSFNVRTQGLSRIIADQKADFTWKYNVRQLEKGRSQEQTHTEFVYAFDHYDTFDYDASGELGGVDDEKLNWLGVKQQFFAAVVETKSGLLNSTGRQEPIDNGEFVKSLEYKGQIALEGGELNEHLNWYFLPLELNHLKSYEGKNFEKILPFGWSFIGSLNRWVFIPLYNFLSGWGLAAGWVIFLMTIVVKLFLSPVMYKQHKLSAMMRVIRPEIDAVNEKYKNADPMKRQQETMQVYRKAGINQMAGCLPALLQVPIFYALFRFFPNMMDLRGKSFWFAEDLTSYDDLIKLPFHIPLVGEHISILAVACTVVILIYTLMTSGNIQQPTQEGMPNMKVMMYIFPVTFFFFLNSAASGLSWYYFVSNAINILIILVIKHFILNEEAIHRQIALNKEKPQTESKFQRRMREMMEKAQEQQKQQEALRNKRKK